MTMLTQTRDKKTIHPKHCHEMAKQRRKLQEQWEKRHEALQNKQENERKPTQNEGKMKAILFMWRIQNKHTSCN